VLRSQGVGVKKGEIGAQPDQLGTKPVPVFLQIFSNLLAHLRSRLLFVIYALSVQKP
jgi:hypothetical protein